MMAPTGPSRIEQLLGQAKLAAAHDLCRLLRTLEPAGRITLAAAEAEQLEELGPLADTKVRTSRKGFHWGNTVFQWASGLRGGPLLVLGGASAPLARVEVIEREMARVIAGGSRTAVVNNLHSSDWVLLSGAEGLESVLALQKADNGIGWALSQEPKFQVAALPTTAASRCDLDTPADLVMLHGHPGLGPALRAHIAEAEYLQDALARRAQLEEVMATAAASLAVIGRASAAAWSALESGTQLWVRLYAEERGMVASRRLARGQVRSLLHELIRRIGVEGFVEWLAETVSGALWDTRVWMGAAGGWPSISDRFAADLGHADEIVDPELAGLVRAIGGSSIPIVCGGHNVVAGGLLALLETLQARQS